MGTICLHLTTLMSAFPSSGRVNLWLQWKQLAQALPGKAGGTAVMTTVDHTLMSAFPSSGRVNLWLQWKQLALPGKAGGTAVMTTVDHTLMRGSKPHDR
jgi:hypothetical protein